MKTNETLRLPEEWAQDEGVTVMDPDGWRSAFAVTVDKAYAPQAWDVPICHDEWQDRMMVSSIIRRRKEACPKCRGAFSVGPDGKRVCRPCKQVTQSNRRRARGGRKGMNRVE